MMRFGSFWRTVLFGASVAVGWLPWVMLAGSLLGTEVARLIYLIVVTATYIAGLSSTGRCHLALAAVTAIGAGSLALSAGTTGNAVVILAVALGVARSGFVYAAPAPGAVVRELILLTAGLWLARFVAGAALMPTSGALWAFFLVQALFFLTPGHRTDAARAQIDAFDAAYRRALSILEERGV